MSNNRGVRFIVVFLLLAVVTSMTGLFAMYFMVSSAPTVSSNSVLTLRVPGGLSERQANPLLTSFMGDVPTVRSVVDSLRKAKVDDRIRGVILMSEANRSPCSGLRASVRGHDQNHIAEISLAAVVVRQSAVIHDLQQQVEYLGVRLLDLIEQQHAMRLLGNGLGQQPALIETDIAGRRTDQPRHGMALHVLGHIEANQLDTQCACQLPGSLRLTDPGGAGEQE